MEKLKLISEGYDLNEIAKELDELSTQNIDIKNDPERASFDGLSLEPASLIISGASVLSALITALLAYLANRRSGTIIITGSSGRKIEIPKDTPKDDIERYVELAKELDADRVIIRQPQISGIKKCSVI